MSGPSKPPGPTTSFFLLAFAISWLLWLPVVLGRLLDTDVPEWGYFLGLPGPMIAGVVLSYRGGRREGVVRLLRPLLDWRVRPWWYLAAVAIPGLVAVLALWVSGIVGTVPDAEFWGYGAVVLLLLSNAALMPLEEVGWRGYALPRLQMKHSALKASLILGVLWGVWHLPVLWIQEGRQTAFGALLPSLALFVAFTALLSVVFTWLYNNTSGSLLIACVFHGAVNASMAMFIVSAEGLRAYAVSALVLGFLLVTLLVAAAGPSSLGRRGRVTVGLAEGGTGTSRDPV